MPGVSEPRSEHEPFGDATGTLEATESRFECDLCGKSFRGAPGGSGLFMWTRGGEIRTEEPPLCKSCALKLTLGAFAIYDDGGGEE